MDVYFALPKVGKLMLEHSFYMLNDEPILFVCQNDVGVRFLCSCCRMYEKWIVGQVSEDALIDMIDERVTIREVFENRCDAQFLVVRDGNQFQLHLDFSPDLFPRAGETLELEREKTGTYRKILESTARHNETMLNLSCIYQSLLSSSDIQMNISALVDSLNLQSVITETYDMMFEYMDRFDKAHQKGENDVESSPVSVPVKAKADGAGDDWSKTNHQQYSCEGTDTDYLTAA